MWISFLRKGDSAGRGGDEPTARSRGLDLKPGKQNLGGVGVEKIALRQAGVYCPKGRFWDSGELFCGCQRPEALLRLGHVR
jgi:hypothetical protein